MPAPVGARLFRGLRDALPAARAHLVPDDAPSQLEGCRAALAACRRRPRRLRIARAFRVREFICLILKSCVFIFQNTELEAYHVIKIQQAVESYPRDLSKRVALHVCVCVYIMVV